VLNKSTAVGAFVVGALAFGVIAILLFGGGRFLTKRLRVVVFFQDSVAGLEVGAPVTLRGVKVGTVRSMKVYLKLPELVPVIPVYLEIDPGKVSWTNGTLGDDKDDVDLAVKAGLRAQLATQSLVTGQLSINLDFHPDAAPGHTSSESNEPEIPSIPSDLQHIKDEIADLKLPEIAEKARIALTGIDQIVGELNGKVGPLADSVRQTADAARATMDTATAAVTQLQLDASRTLAGMNHAMAKAEAVIGEVNDMAAPRAPMRGDLEAAVHDLAASTSSLRNFSRELERNPSALLLGRSSK
jgi:paraquat-inducible protein B